MAMTYYTSLAELPSDFGPSAVTIGKFDGMHDGHREVVDELKAEADDRGLVSTVLTFDRNPLALLHPAEYPLSLMSLAQKREALEATGIDALVVIEFDRAFSELTPEEFVQQVLVDATHAALVLVGENFRFGHDGAGTVQRLAELGREHGFEVRSIPQVKPDGTRVISSSWIRTLLTDGEITEATQLLGHRPSVRGLVVRGEQRGRRMGYPTANLAEDLEGFVPADGVYAAIATIDGVEMPAAVSVGDNPTFTGVRAKQVEAHILDANLDLYGKTIEVAFVQFMRPMVKFTGVPALVEQMHRDEDDIRRVLGVPSLH
jgi:riboflavin kinase/FMN adenylyltransferase